MSATDPLNETSSYFYDTAGRLTKIVRALAGAVTTSTFDTSNRLGSLTDSQGYTLLFGYDNADRVTKITYPDGTSTVNTYKLLELASTTDRLKRTTQYTYDALRRIIQVMDPLGRNTKFGYCDCGAVSRLTDPNGNSTIFNFDLEERLVGKVMPDGTQTTYGYENSTSRRKTITDALGQTTTYTYNRDDTLSAISFSHSINPTAGVTLTWDPAFRRVLSMTDGTGTTTFAYKPVTSPPALGAALLGIVTGPTGDSVSYAYDKLGRPATTSVDGAAWQRGYDAIGRVISEKNQLDTFTIGYLGATGLPASIKSALGSSISYTYFNNLGDERLKTISNQTHSGQLVSGLQYGYDAAGELTSAIIQKQFAGTRTDLMTYDSAGQVTKVTATGGNNFAFTYDPGANRTSQKIGAATTAYMYNKVNELTSPGPVVYDNEGELLEYQSTTYKWDAAHRLISVTTGTNTTKFAYDGFGRRTRITQMAGTTVLSDKSYFWCGTNICLETDAKNHNAITKRYFPEGVVQGGHPFYYALDNLNSVRELVDSLGVVQASYDYDPFGARQALISSENSDFGFAGLFHDSQSGVDLAVHRPYSAALGRWLSRDPIGEVGGVNLYAYVLNNPLSQPDPAGTGNGGGNFSVGPGQSQTLNGWTVTTDTNGNTTITSPDGGFTQTIGPGDSYTGTYNGQNITFNNGVNGSSGTVTAQYKPYDTTPPPKPKKEGKLSCKIKSGAKDPNVPPLSFPIND